MAQVIWTQMAKAEIRAIAEYIEQDSAVYSKITTKKLIDAAQRLSVFPSSGRIVPEIDSEIIREIICGNYRIMYLCLEETVIIISVLHSKQDLAARLNR